MHWIAPSEKEDATPPLERKLWDATEQARRMNCELWNPSCDVQLVRRSSFVIQHCPDQHDATGRFNFVAATATLVSAKTTPAKPDRRSVGEADLHHVWIQLFHSVLNEEGRAVDMKSSRKWRQP